MHDQPEHVKAVYQPAQNMEEPYSKSFNACLLKPVSRKSLLEKVQPNPPIDWLVSDYYTGLVMGPSDCQFAVPVLPHSPEDPEFLLGADLFEMRKRPIIIDENVRHVGRTPNMDFYPPVILIWGRTRFLEALATEARLLVWVGTRCFDLL